MEMIAMEERVLLSYKLVLICLLVSNCLCAQVFPAGELRSELSSNNVGIDYIKGAFKVEVRQYSTPDMLASKRMRLDAYRKLLAEATGPEAKVYETVINGIQTQLLEIEKNGFCQAESEFSGVISTDLSKYKVTRKFGGGDNPSIEQYVSNGLDTMSFAGTTAVIDLADSEESCDFRSRLSIVERWGKRINDVVNTLTPVGSEIFEGHVAEVYREDFGGSYRIHTVVKDYNNSIVETKGYWAEDEALFSHVVTHDWRKMDNGLWRPMALTMTSYNRLSQVLDGLSGKEGETCLMFTDTPEINPILPANFFEFEVPSKATRVSDHRVNFEYNMREAVPNEELSLEKQDTVVHTMEELHSEAARPVTDDTTSSASVPIQGRVPILALLGVLVLCLIIAFGISLGVRKRRTH